MISENPKNNSDYDSLTLTVLLVMIMGVAMIIPSNLAFASPDDGSDDGESVNQDDGGDQEEQDDQTEPEESEEQPTEEPIEALPQVDEEPIDLCVEDPDACVLEPEPSIDPCLDNPDLPECQPPSDPCLDNPDLPECQDPCILNPDLPECIPPVICPDGEEPLPDGSCPPVIECGPGTHLENEKCVPNKNNGGGSSSSSSSAITIVNAAEVPKL